MQRPASARFNGQAHAADRRRAHLRPGRQRRRRTSSPSTSRSSADGTTAWVTLQENNALAMVDIAAATVTEIVPLGFKDHALPATASTPATATTARSTSATGRCSGMYLPDAIAAYRRRRDLPDHRQRRRLARVHRLHRRGARQAQLALDPTAFPNAAALKDDAQPRAGSP